jgi:probable F420-dependent oxidoreductase
MSNSSRPAEGSTSAEGSLLIGDTLSCGTVIAGGDGAAVLDRSRRIEAAGFDSLWVGDHVAFTVPILESMTLLSFAAAATSRVRLCSGIYLLPLRHPTTTAKVASTLDVLSGGRLTLGIGVGGEFPAEFEACGVPVEERGPRADEGIEILRRLWTEDDVVHRGRHFSFGPITMAPRPVQSGGPPIIVGGRKGASFRRIGRLGDGYISHMCSPEQYADNMTTIREHAAAAGHRQKPFEPIVFAFTVMNDDFEKANERAARLLNMIYRRDFSDAARKYCFLGRPEDMLEQMQAFARAGARHFVFSLLSDSDEFFAAYENVIAPGLSQIEL